MGLLFGKVNKEYSIPRSKKTVSEKLIQLIAETEELEKGISYIAGFEILSKKKLFADLLKRNIYTCFCKLKEKGDKTIVSITIKTYWYMELSTLLAFLFLLVFFSYQIYKNVFPIDFKIILPFFALFWWSYRNYSRKKEGVQAVEKLLNKLMSNDLEKTDS